MKVITIAKTGDEETVEPGFAELVQQISGKELRQCYHCLKCSAGCPINFAMDWAPNQIIRMVQLGLQERVLSSSTIWLCASCETCSTRCPNEVDLPTIMDTLKEMAIQNGIRSQQAGIQTFHRVFLNCLREYGRMHEVSLLALYKLLTLNPFEDMGLGIKMFRKGKLNLLPSRIENVHELETIFRTFGESKRSKI
ncbi:MAG: 4Fe-4S dicluster domain-containing protein [Candidatus Aerophobetes bacterium]